MPLPSPFLNATEVLLALKGSKKKYKALYSDAFDSQMGSIIRSSVAGNTFRSSGFNGGEYTSSSIFRTWAQDYVFGGKKFYPRIVEVSSKAEYKRLHSMLKKSLDVFWKQYYKKGLLNCYYFKLIDLLMKAFVTFEGLQQNQRQVLLGLIYVPLDRYTLHAISTLWNEQNRTKILSNPSMGFIANNEDVYYNIQNFIAEAIGDSNNPIEYDIAVWSRSPENIPFTVMKRKTKRQEMH